MSQPSEKSVWDVLDQEPEHLLAYPGDCFACDGCECRMEGKFYNLRVNNDDLTQFCLQCFDKAEQHLEEIITKQFSPIDRTQFTPEQKPLQWPCIGCGTKLGGGHKWRVWHDTHDLCEKCNASTLKEKLELVQDCKVIGSRRPNPLLASFAAVPHRTIPPSFVKEVTPERMNQWVDILRNIVLFPTVNVFGSLKQWAPITDLYNVPVEENAKSMFLVDCSEKTNGRVALVVRDVSDYVAIYILFHSIQEYEQGYQEWLEFKKTRDHTKVIHTLEEHQKDVALTLCEEFSGYMLIQKNFDLYYDQ